MIADQTIAGHLALRAGDSPDRPALICPAGRLTYRELYEASTRCGVGLLERGIRAGVRTAVLVPPGPELFILAFALVGIGAVPVLIDPGIGWRNLARCLAEAEPVAFIGSALADWAGRTLGWGKRTVRTRITVGRPGTPGSIPFSDLMRSRNSGRRGEEDVSLDEPAAIVFTSGSTGPPKGVVYTQRTFAAQAQLLNDNFGIRPGEVDLATFPLFALFDPALQMTSVLPKMDFTRPGSVDPGTIVCCIRENSVTHMFGSPALLERVGIYGEEHAVRLPTVRRVFSAGAPVPPSTLERIARMLGPDASIHTPYGATEALPVCSITHSERERLGGPAQGKGICVGKPLPGVQVDLIGVSDDPIPVWSDDLRLEAGKIGEIAVRGPNVSRAYFRRPEADRLAKIEGARGSIHHRMGDLGYFDSEGRLWFCGRKSQRVRTTSGTLFTVPCEGVFNAHPEVRRTALVGVGEGSKLEPVLCVELKSGCRRDREDIRKELLALGSRVESTQPIRTILFHPRFPVDIRHNAKIFREKLAVWASRQMGVRP